MSKFLDLTGKKFTRLTVIERVENTAQGGAQWRCVCSCGVERIVGSHNLRLGLSRSCGCLSRERTTKGVVYPQAPYHSTHRKITAQRGKASTHPCKECGEPAAAQWAYMGCLYGDPIVGGKLVWCEHPNCYEPLCVADHRAFDKATRELVAEVTDGEFRSEAELFTAVKAELEANRP